MNNPQTSKNVDQPQQYKICLKGQLDARWSNWFDGLGISSDDRGNTVLSGQIQDQAELHGILKKIYSLGLTLISVNPQSEGSRQQDSNK